MSGELAATYLGLKLRSPVIMGACPLTMEPETVRQLEGVDAGAIVLPSMLQEQILHWRIKSSDPLGAIEQSGYQPQQDKYNGGTVNYLKTIRSLKQTSDVPIIASINGSCDGQWLDYAQEINAAGADALELNLQSFCFDPNETSNATESRLCDMVRRVADSISIPLAVKIGPRYTNLVSMARQLHDAGAKGIVLFMHLPHWDVCTDRNHWTIRWELSPVDSLGGTLEGIVRVRAGKLGMSIAASGGVATSEDAIKAFIAGADVVMVTSAVYREGPDAIRKIVDGIERHLELNHYPTLNDFKKSQPTIEVGPERMMRLEYVDPLTRTETYFDPTPIVSRGSGDAFGHRN